MTDLLIVLFFGAALLIGLWYTLLLLRKEMAGKERLKPDEYDYGFGPARTETKPRS